jgi:hypothetical protein
MAQRGRPMGRLHQDDVRAKIQVGQLLKTLERQALDPEAPELSVSRMKAIEILLRKSLPDLSAVTVSGDKDNPLQVAWPVAPPKIERP